MIWQICSLFLQKGERRRTKRIGTGRTERKVPIKRNKFTQNEKREKEGREEGRKEGRKKENIEASFSAEHREMEMENELDARLGTNQWGRGDNHAQKDTLC